MPVLTPQFQFQYERRMRAITEDEYVRRLAAENTWWNKVLRTIPVEGKTERITWLLNTATIEQIGPTLSGGITFEELVTQTVEYPTFKHGKGMKVQRDQIEDLEGTGLNELTEWSKQIGNEMAYYPQRLATQLILNGSNTDGSANAYDTVPFFASHTTTTTIGGVSVTGHPYNPYRPSLGGYANQLSGSSSGSYPGAVPIDDSVSADTALQNLGKAIAYISSVKMPNGVDPRFLTPAYIMAPPRMAPRLRQLLDAKFLAQVASSGAGSADVQAIISGWGLGAPVIANELGANFSYTYNAPFITTAGNPSFVQETVSGSDTTYYIVCKQSNESVLGGLLYLLRKPFKVTYYTGDSGGTGMTAELDRADEFEYHVKGRMSVQYGHPYVIFKCGT